MPLRTRGWKSQTKRNPLRQRRADHRVSPQGPGRRESTATESDASEALTGGVVVQAHLCDLFHILPARCARDGAQQRYLRKRATLIVSHSHAHSTSVVSSPLAPCRHKQARAVDSVRKMILWLQEAHARDA
jgi:hypothetical protein